MGLYVPRTSSGLESRAVLQSPPENVSKGLLGETSGHKSSLVEVLDVINYIPRVGDDDIIDGTIAAAEPGKTNLEHHRSAALWLPTECKAYQLEFPEPGKEFVGARREA